MADGQDTAPELAEWAEVLVHEFGLEVEQVPVDRILKLAAVAAHGVTRPAAPLSAFVAGLVAGQLGGSPEEIADAIASIESLVADRDEETG
ncbi:MAG TPA: DUF6457 domain-containing protein [Microbacteriaceae bacterium]|nr:DUF6457 domain-containing protein [Microbacteriaceae bacterium]